MKTSKLWLLVFSCLSLALQASAPARADHPIEFYLGDNPKHPWANAKYAYPKQQKLEIDPDRLGQCFAAAMLLDSKNTTVDRTKMNWDYDEDKFFSYLAAYPRYRSFQASTEGTLKGWILAQPENSIDPLSFFRKSLELNNYNAWNALLANYQLLRQNARWWVKDFSYNSDYDKQSQLFNKFIDIRGDLRERGGSYTGDHAGSWYRMWGIMLYRMMQTKDSDWQAMLKGTRVGFFKGLKTDANDTWGGLKSMIVGTGAEATKWKVLKFIFHPPFDEDDDRKSEINHVGGEVIGAMADMLQDQHKKLLPNLDPYGCENPSYYLHELDESTPPPMDGLYYGM